MSIIQQHTSASLGDAWRTINIDALDPDSSQNFDVSTLHPPLPEVGEAEARQLNGQVRQLLRGGDAEGALRGCLESPVYNGSDAAKVRLLIGADGGGGGVVCGVWCVVCVAGGGSGIAPWARGCLVCCLPVAGWNPRRYIYSKGDGSGCRDGYIYMYICVCADLVFCRDKQQETHLQTVVEVLQSIKASEMTPILQRIHGSPGGSELLDVLMKYL